MKSQEWVVGLLSVLVIILAGYLFTSQSHNDYQKLLRRCSSSNQNKYANCVGEELLDYSNKNPIKTGDLLSYVYQNASKEAPIDLRLFSDYSHDVGMILAGKKLDLTEASKVCGESFMGGCMHGFVMDRLDEESFDAAQLTAMTNYCEPLKNSKQPSHSYMNCLHGVGHEYWAKGRTNLNQALAYCDKLSKTSYKNACWSGVIMEYSKNGISTGHHSHSVTARIDVPCQDLDEQYRLICYTSEGSYRQYYPGKESIGVTQKYCDSSPAAYRSSCKTAASERLKLATGKL